MGGRLLRSWVEQPLLDKNEINHRLDAVAELVGNRVIGISLSEALDGIYDLERLLSKVSYRNLNARDCLALFASFKKIPAIKNLLSDASSYELKSIRDELDTMEDLTNLLESSIHPDAPILITEGGIIRDGYSQELDEYREAQKNGKQWILDLEQKERDATGIRNLRVQYNKVFGYYIEVTNSHLSKVPSDYVRKQTLTGGERFITDALKKHEDEVLTAQVKANEL
jgi:DNA mismatch repair protein MutS